ncbi:hypothetical protein AB0D45_00385 [Streptomyces sp. NPDC048352]|uniref:hypothetical protein n=1 Tax=Streptomyces sp. NPDC048352 TaxID=3154718 RepID=UPI00342D9098
MGTDFDLDAYAHHVAWSAPERRVEIGLRALADQSVDSSTASCRGTASRPCATCRTPAAGTCSSSPAWGREPRPGSLAPSAAGYVARRQVRVHGRESAVAWSKPDPLALPGGDPERSASTRSPLTCRGTDGDGDRSADT